MNRMWTSCAKAAFVDSRSNSNFPPRGTTTYGQIGRGPRSCAGYQLRPSAVVGRARPAARHITAAAEAEADPPARRRDDQHAIGDRGRGEGFPDEIRLP